MAQQNDAGDKNEAPTPKRLRDSRRDGNVAKSRDLTQTIGLATWLLIAAGFSGIFADRLARLVERSWTSVGVLSPAALIELGSFAFATLLWLTLAPLALACLAGLVAEFLQVGPLLAPQKIAPKGSHLHPLQGFKRMFARENLFETAKAIAKTLLLVVLLGVLVLRYLDEALRLPFTDASEYSELSHHVVMKLGMWVTLAFAAVSIADWLFQKHNHEKRLRMSLHEIRQEFKQSEGDPQLKGQRKQLHREWSMQDIAQAGREASAVVVNPTHIAIALSFKPDEFPLPLVSAKAEGADALRMREAAHEAHVPVLRNVPLARELNFRADYDDVVPADLFDAVAEVLAWAARVRAQSRPDSRESVGSAPDCERARTP